MDEQRLDVLNGLMLALHPDSLFDSGSMTVAADGSVEYGQSLGAHQRQQNRLDGRHVC